MELVSTIYLNYGFLLGSLIFGLLWVVIYKFRKDLRKEIILSSLAFLPLGFTEILYKEYWEPKTMFDLIEKYGVSIEDFLFCFFIGGVAATIWEFVFKKKEHRIDHKRHKHHILSIAGLMMFLGLLIELYLPYYTIFTMSFFLIFFIVFWATIFRRDLILHVLESSFVFMIVYMVILYVVTVPVDYFDRFYKPEYMTGVYFLSMPFEEYLFSFSAGMLGAFVYKYFTDAKISK